MGTTFWIVLLTFLFLFLAARFVPSLASAILFLTRFPSWAQVAPITRADAVRSRIVRNVYSCTIYLGSKSTANANPKNSKGYSVLLEGWREVFDRLLKNLRGHPKWGYRLPRTSRNLLAVRRSGLGMRCALLLDDTSIYGFTGARYRLEIKLAAGDLD